MKKYDYLVVGAGLFGATFVAKMTEINKKCLVIEKRGHVAGNAYTERINDIDVHVYGPHIFHTNDEEVWQFVNSYTRFKPYINSPLAIYNNCIYNLPFNMNTFAKMWNITTPEEAKKIIDDQRKKSGIDNPKNLEEQAISMVGIDIYEKLIKGYTEKQWNTHPKNLPASIIKRLPVRFTYDNNYFNDKYQGIPEDGYTTMVLKMLEGVDVLLNCNYLEKRDFYDSLAKKVIYTGSIDEYFNFQFGQLDYRSLKFEQEEMFIENYQGNAVINYTDEAVPFTRSIEHKFFNFKNQPTTIVSKEYPASFSETKEPFYPINNEENNTLYNKYLDLEKSLNNVIFGGRLGEYKYYDMHHSIKRAMLLALQEMK